MCYNTDMKIVETENLEALSALASAIVKEYYDPIVGAAQNDYMIARFQSVEGIRRQVAEGYRYYVLCEEQPVGFLGFYPRGDELYLSKLYLRKEARGKGYGRAAFAFLKGEAEKVGLRKITLNVNKYNPTIQIYEKLGMKQVRAEVNDIGGGYVMDDYVYSLVW